MRKKWLPLLLCLVLIVPAALSGCARSSMDLVVGQVGGENITVREVTLYANYILLTNGQSRGSLTAENIADLNKSALATAIRNRLICQKAASMGLYPLSNESQQKADNKFVSFMAQIESAYLSYYQEQAKSDPSVDAGAMAKAAADQNLAAADLTEDDIRSLMAAFEASDLVSAETTKDVAVSADEIKAEYDKLLSSQQSTYASSPAAYDSALTDGTTVIVCRPQGYRYIKHILIAMPADIAAGISSATSTGDSASIASLRKQGLAAIKSKADEALAKVQGGGDFDALMAEYGEDPGMKAEPAKTEGYQVGAQSSYVPEFLKAAMDLGRPGDTTGLVDTDYGYHIIRYVGDVPAGPLPLEQVRDRIGASVLATKRSDAFEALVKKWTSETAIKQNPAKMPVVTAAPTA